MFCTNCGAPLADHDQFCPSCGKKTDQQGSDQSPPTPPPLPVKKSHWKKWLGMLVILALLFFSFLYFASKELTETVEKQLEALRKNKITEAYYSYTSKDFQNTTSLEKFKEFIQHYPEFYDNQSINFYDSTFENNILTLKGVLISKNNQKLHVEYKLIDEDGIWKILSIELIDPHSSSSFIDQKDHLQSLVQDQLAYLQAEDLYSAYTKTISNKSLQAAVDKQLKALSKGKLKEAYQLTSKEFQINTPLALFEKYIKEFPLLSQHAATKYGRSVVEREAGVIEVELLQFNKSMTVDYALKKELGSWKIWGMQINQTVQKGELVTY